MDLSLRSHRASPFALFLVLALPLALVACGGDSTSDAGVVGDAPSPDAGRLDAGALDAGALDAICERTSLFTTSDGDTVLRCDEPYAARPWVRVPPASTEGGVEVLHGALLLETLPRIVLADGTELVVVDDAGEPVPFHSERWPAALHWPSARVLVFLYRFEGERRTVTLEGESSAAFELRDARPWAWLPPDVIDGAALGAWEGRIAGRRDVPEGLFVYDLEQGAPIRVEYTSLAPLPTGLIAWDVQEETLADGARSTVVGSIVNMRAGVMGADGSCIAALEGQPRIPFDDATDGRLSLERIAAMHVPGDMVLSHAYPTGSEWASAGGMEGLFVLHPGAFIQDAARERWTTYAPWPHGTPDGMRLEIRRVEGGGGPCP